MEGMLAYKVYRVLSYGLSPLVHLHLRWRRFRGLEDPHRWPERLGRPSVSRPSGPLIWFHAVSLGEGMAAIPVIRRCREFRPDWTILMTTTTLSAFEVIKDRLPAGVIYQFAPLDIPSAIGRFLGHWKPNAVALIESELWPNLIMGVSSSCIPLVLLNARMSVKSLRLWSKPAILPLISLLLSKFSLIVPLSAMQAIRFQLLQAPPFIINFSGDLKFAVNHNDASEEFMGSKMGSTEELKAQLFQRKVWIAGSLHKGEEEVILGVHNKLVQMFPDLITIIVPRHPQHGRLIVQKLRKLGQAVALRSENDKLTAEVKIYMVDTLGELRNLYRLASVAVIGGSFLPDFAGHNISEAAAAGCAVVTGPHVGHFSQMVLNMQRSNCLSVLQVSGQSELEEVLKELFSNQRLLRARQTASKQAFYDLSNCIIEDVWGLLSVHVFMKNFQHGRLKNDVKR